MPRVCSSYFPAVPPVKRKREQDGKPQKRIRKCSGSETQNVNIITLYRLVKKIVPNVRHSSKNAEQAFKNFRQIKLGKNEDPLFSHFMERKSSEKIDYSQLWVTIPKKNSPANSKIYLNFTLEEGEFFSHSLLQEQHCSPKQKVVFYLKVFEGDENRFPIIHIRCGKEGEALWLKKGNKLSGSQVKNLCFNFLKACPLVDTLYLADDAKVLLNVQGQKGVTAKPVHLSKILMAASDDGKSWYGHSGFTPASCDNWETKHGTHSQNPSAYCAAVEKLRNISFEELNVIFGKYTRRLSWLQKIISENFMDRPGVTLHEIAKCVHTLWKECSANIEHSTNLYHLHQWFLIPFKMKSKNPPEGAANYNRALEIINSHYLWQRTFKHPEENRTFTQCGRTKRAV